MSNINDIRRRTYSNKGGGIFGYSYVAATADGYLLGSNDGLNFTKMSESPVLPNVRDNGGWKYHIRYSETWNKLIVYYYDGGNNSGLSGYMYIGDLKSGFVLSKIKRYGYTDEYSLIPGPYSIMDGYKLMTSHPTVPEIVLLPIDYEGDLKDSDRRYFSTRYSEGWESSKPGGHMVVKSSNSSHLAVLGLKAPSIKFYSRSLDEYYNSSSGNLDEDIIIKFGLTEDSYKSIKVLTDKYVIFSENSSYTTKMYALDFDNGLYSLVQSSNFSLDGRNENAVYFEGEYYVVSLSNNVNNYSVYRIDVSDDLSGFSLIEIGNVLPSPDSSKLLKYYRVQVIGDRVYILPKYGIISQNYDINPYIYSSSDMITWDKVTDSETLQVLDVTSYKDSVY